MNELTIKKENQQALNFIYKSILGFIPIPGLHLFGELIDYRAEVQQIRLNKFTEFLKESFERITEKPFDEENLKTVEFIDAFEVIIRKVVYTKSEEKLKRYSNILLRAMYEKDDSEMFLKYVNLVDEISETQVLILSSLNSVSDLTEIQIMESLSNQSNSEGFMSGIQSGIYILSTDQTIPVSEITFYIHELKSKGIIALSSPVTDVPPIIYALTPIGKGFLDFIAEFGDS